MTLTAIVGALVALVARPTEPQRTRDQDEIERLKRAQRKLLDRIETLELDNQGLIRELAAERNLLTHWIGEAARFARDAREERELRRGPQQYSPNHLQGQLYSPDAQQAQQAARAADAVQPCRAFAGHCNCVPSRAQMLGAMTVSSTTWSNSSTSSTSRGDKPWPSTSARLHRPVASANPDERPPSPQRPGL